ncbi:NlpC/P60 family protein [Streptomyces sp. NPDC127190]|uniref:NlpC/P60 family protein n=1 Tax=unclassified Streptomyces TaxID=2593676 RepID=UPI003637985F
MAPESRDEVRRRVASLYDQAENATGNYNATRALSARTRSRAVPPAGRAGRTADPVLDQVARQWFEAARAQLGPTVPAVLPADRLPPRPAAPPRALGQSGGAPGTGEEPLRAALPAPALERAAGRPMAELPPAPTPDTPSRPPATTTSDAISLPPASLTLDTTSRTPAALAPDTTSLMPAALAPDTTIPMPAVSATPGHPALTGPSGPPPALLQPQLPTAAGTAAQTSPYLPDLTAPLPVASGPAPLSAPSGPDWSVAGPGPDTAERTTGWPAPVLDTAAPVDWPATDFGTTAPPEPPVPGTGAAEAVGLGALEGTPLGAGPAAGGDGAMETAVLPVTGAAGAAAPGPWTLPGVAAPGRAAPTVTKAENLRRFTAARDLLARGAEQPARTAGAGTTAAPVVGPRAAKAIAFARAQLGKPCVWGATGPDSYDCSSLTQAAWKAAGVTLPRAAHQQALAGAPITLDAIEPGDLVLFFDDDRHVGLYTGDGMMVHAPGPGSSIREESVLGAGETAIHRIVRPA